MRKCLRLVRASGAGVDSCIRTSRFDQETLLRLISLPSRSRTAYSHFRAIKCIHLGNRSVDSTLGAKSHLVSPMLKTGNTYRYKHSLPKPQFSEDPAQAKADSIHLCTHQVGYSLVIRRMCGLSMPPTASLKALILHKTARVFPIELRSILYKFCASHMGDMNLEELNMMGKIVDTALQCNDASILGYITAKRPVDDAMLSMAPVWTKILNYVWKDHPLLQDLKAHSSVMTAGTIHCQHVSTGA
ncbi:hypothetical protein BBOV_I004840 [Babesia bovis T2Bo]|uniref:Uncharacterized protein n=1 Tax=Babesia bovis TaxID=5865 RepID=A7AWY7_BABBO|nr:hypothetical protein BBOV_I004840 [Babesia bovis T2Bo]EDO05565.1 hypothetical protein BBOV_I004840 [Babesia bovis T2Bo]|eukprot:XP_001609133.1 hypothetical protein [Babesia bovis T2Bo]